jgi:hypothetical protein
MDLGWDDSGSKDMLNDTPVSLVVQDLRRQCTKLDSCNMHF